MNKVIIKPTEIFYIKTLKINKFFMFRYFNIRKKSILGDIFNRIYEHFFKNSICLYKEYNRFYKKDYSSFNDFLCKKYNLNDYDANCLCDKRLYYKNFADEIDINITQLLEDKDFYFKFQQFFCDKEVKNED